MNQCTPSTPCRNPGCLFCDPAGNIDATAPPAEKKVKAGGKDEPTIPELLVGMANDRYDVFLGADGEPYAVEKGGKSSITLPLRGRTGLKQRLAMLLWDSRGKVPSGQASADTLNVLEGQALNKPRRPIFLRVARDGDGLLIDMGTADGKLIECGPDGWRVVTSGPALFRRTALTGATPDPDPAGTLDAFRAGLNVSEENFRLIVGWMLHAFIPDEPHPVLGLLGEQGTAKTTAAKQIAGIVDPSPAPTRTAPKDLTDWAVTASGSWLVTIDNISEIKPWFSDALCKAVTGDAMTKRALYTDGDLSVLVFLRPVIMTSIEAGALRGDLAERLLLVELERIPKEARRTEKDVRTLYERHQAQTLGAMLNLLSQVLKVLPDVEAADLPRMADFTRFLVALDQVTGWNTRADYEETFADLADAVISGDPFADAIRKNLDSTAEGFQGTASELLKWAEPKTDGGSFATPPRGWPKTPHGASGALKRIIPALTAAGIKVEFYREGKKGTRKVRIERADTADTADAVSGPLYPQTETGYKEHYGENRAGDSFGRTASAVSAVSAAPPEQQNRADAPADTRGEADARASARSTATAAAPTAHAWHLVSRRGEHGNTCPGCRAAVGGPDHPGTGTR